MEIPAYNSHHDANQGCSKRLCMGNARTDQSQKASDHGIHFVTVPMVQFAKLQGLCLTEPLLFAEVDQMLIADLAILAGKVSAQCFHGEAPEET